jgi:hypothetical protein
MYIETLAVFALVHLLAAASPGPNLVVVCSYASTVSRKAVCLPASASFSVCLHGRPRQHLGWQRCWPTFRLFIPQSGLSRRLELASLGVNLPVFVTNAVFDHATSEPNEVDRAEQEEQLL